MVIREERRAESRLFQWEEGGQLGQESLVSHSMHVLQMNGDLGNRMKASGLETDVQLEGWVITKSKAGEVRAVQPEGLSGKPKSGLVVGRLRLFKE